MSTQTAEIRLYASLTGPLLGLYYPLPFDTEQKCRKALATSRLKQLWCAVYTREEVEQQIKQYGGIILPKRFERHLDYDSHEVERA